jgi:peptide/nickel transport system substrate-binding protein
LKDVAALEAQGFPMTYAEDAVTNFCLVPSSADPNSALSKLEVRQAVAYAIDQDALIQAITYGLGKKTQQLFPFGPFMNTDVVGYPYNPDEARRLLDEAGYGNGLTLTITYNEGTQDSIPALLQDMLSNVGITVNLNKVSYIQSAGMIFGSGWDGFLVSYTFPGNTIDPGFTAGMYITQGGWVSLAKPADIAAEINAAAEEPDAATRAAMYQKISADLVDVCEWQFMYYSGAYTSINPTLKGYTNGQYVEFWSYTYAYFED